MARLFVLILVLISSPYVCQAACPDNPITSQSYTCGDGVSRLTDSTALNIPSGQRSITIMFDYKINSLCSLSGAVHFFVLTLTVSGTERKIADFSWNESNLLWNVNVQDTSGSSSARSGTMTSSIMNLWARGGVTINLSSNDYGVAVLYQYYRDQVSPSVSFGSWTFDSTMKLYFCGDAGGTNVNAFACDVRNVVIYYNYFTGRGSLVLGSTANLIANYLFTEGSGYSVPDQIGGVGTAYFGASTTGTQDTTNSPSWLSPGPGIQFTATTQYVKIPTFTVQVIPGFSDTLSVGWSMWLQVTTAPSSGSHYIFRYYTTSSSTDRISLKVNSARGLDLTWGGITWSSSNSAVTLSRWNQLVVRLTWNDNTGSNSVGTNYQGFVSVNLGTTSLQAGSINGNKATLSTSTDQVRVGGFIGSMAHLQIFSYTAQIVNTASCSSTCALDLGFANPPLCLMNNSCPTGTYKQDDVCLSCDPTCATCTGPGSCATCPDGYFKSGSTCILCTAGTYPPTSTSTSCSNCASECATCTSLTTCQSCNTGYTLDGTTCDPDPCPLPAQYRTGATCTDCDTGCTSCTGPANCQTCSAPGYYLSGTTCNTCTGGTFAETSTSTGCTNCPSVCATCTSLTNCQSCNAGYSLSGTTCEPDPCPLPAQYRTGATCTDCDTGCASCTGPGNCQTCSAPEYYLSGTTCNTCTDGTFAETSTSTGCTNCPSMCETCTSLTNCQSCNDGYSLSGTTCQLDPCPLPAQYRVGATCYDCDTGCATCSAPGNCQTCSTGYYLQGTTCQPCASGTYAATSTSTSCTTCPSECTTCTSATSCQSCADEYLLDGSVCYSPYEPIVGSVYNPDAESGMIILGFIIGGTTGAAVTAYIISKCRKKKIVPTRSSRIRHSKRSIVPLSPSADGLKGSDVPDDSLTIQHYDH